MVKKKPEVINNSEVSFVRVDNANMVKLTLKQISKLYAQYAKLILDIKDLKDRKMETRTEMFRKIDELEKEFSVYKKLLPKEPPVSKTTVRKAKYPREKLPEVEFEGEDSFANLKKEFEHIRDELERMR